MYRRNFKILSRLLLCCIFCASCGQKYGPAFIKYNKYDSFESLKNHWENTLIINYPEEEVFFFDLDIADYSVDYYVAGIDYSYRNNHESASNSNNLSDYLFTKEIFYQFSDNDLIVTVVFKKRVEFDPTKLFWTDKKPTFSGSVLNYEQNADGECWFLCFDDSTILSLKFNILNIEESIFLLFSKTLLQCVLQYS